MLIQNDKLLHCLAGVALFAVANLISNPSLAIAVVVAVGLGKEIVDSLGSGTPDIYDFVATVLGGGLGYLCSI